VPVNLRKGGKYRYKAVDSSAVIVRVIENMFIVVPIQIGVTVQIAICKGGRYRSSERNNEKICVALSGKHKWARISNKVIATICLFLANLGSLEQSC
jgi:hypothetical protein